MAELTENTKSAQKKALKSPKAQKSKTHRYHSLTPFQETPLDKVAIRKRHDSIINARILAKIKAEEAQRKKSSAEAEKVDNNAQLDEDSEGEFDPDAELDAEKEMIGERSAKEETVELQSVVIAKIDNFMQVLPDLPKDEEFIDQSKEQLYEIKETFDMFKSDSGKLPFSSLMKAMNALGFNPDNFTMTNILEKYELDRNSSLDFDLFYLIVRRKYTEENNEDDIKEAFNIFDTAGNGYIMGPELRLVMANLGEKLTEEEIEEMVREADLDGDGTIDYYEFTMMMKTR